jgi:hypothetical protein
MNRVCPSSPHATLEVGCPVSIVPGRVPSEAITLNPSGRTPKMLPLQALGRNERKKSELKSGEPTGSHTLNYRYGTLGGITEASKRETS